jgi:DNA replication protein DnaC
VTAPPGPIGDAGPNVKALSESPPRACPLGVCDGSGWILGPEDVARPCECRDRRIAKARTHGIASVIPRKFRSVSFELLANDGLDPTALGRIREYVDNLDENIRGGRGIWLIGDVGTGKTALAMLVSKTALERGHSVAIYSLPGLLARMRKTYSAEAGEDSYLQFFERLASVDLLHMDDLGAEKRTDWVIEQLYSVVNERYESERPIIVTTNIEKEDEEARMTPLAACLDRLERQVGQRTVSRLYEICGEPLPLFGGDMRRPEEKHMRRTYSRGAATASDASLSSDRPG